MIRFSPATGSSRQAILLEDQGWELRFDSTLSTQPVPRPDNIPADLPPTNGDFWFWLQLDADRSIIGLIDVSQHGWVTIPLIKSLQNNLSYLDQVYSREGAGTPLKDLSEFGRRFLTLSTSLDELLPDYATNCFAGQLVMLHAGGRVEVLNLGTLGPWRRDPGEDWQLVRLNGNAGYQYCETKEGTDPGDTPLPPEPVDAADRFQVEAGTDLFFSTDGVYENGRCGSPARLWWDAGVRSALNQLPPAADLDVCLDQVQNQLSSAYPPGHPVAWPEDDTTMLLIRRLGL